MLLKTPIFLVITCGALGEEQGGAEERVAGAPSSAALPRLGHRGLDGTFLKTEKSETCPDLG